MASFASVFNSVSVTAFAAPPAPVVFTPNIAPGQRPVEPAPARTEMRHLLLLLLLAERTGAHAPGLYTL